MIATFNGERLFVKHAEELIGWDGPGNPVFRLNAEELAWLRAAFERRWHNTPRRECPHDFWRLAVDEHDYRLLICLACTKTMEAPRG